MINPRETCDISLETLGIIFTSVRTQHVLPKENGWFGWVTGHPTANGGRDFLLGDCLRQLVLKIPPHTTPMLWHHGLKLMMAYGTASLRCTNKGVLENQKTIVVRRISNKFFIWEWPYSLRENDTYIQQWNLADNHGLFSFFFGSCLKIWNCNTITLKKIQGPFTFM